jgi:photosystem II stability/assembly factor-like uncharacterized protein
VHRALAAAAILVHVVGCSGDEPSRDVARGEYVPVTIEFWDADHGVVVLEHVDLDDVKVLESTDDGGRTWQMRAYEPGWTDPRERDFPRLGRGRDWHEVVDVVDRDSAWTLHWNGRRFLGLERTEDGGRTWIKVTNPCRLPQEALFTPLSAPAPRQAWLLCQGGVARNRTGSSGEGKALYSTVDGGRTWKLVASTPAKGRSRAGKGLPVPGRVDEMWFSTGGFGALLGVDAPLSLTMDGGRTWRRRTLRRDGRVTTIRVASNRVAYALFKDDAPAGVNRLFRTGDHGRTWNQVRAWTYPPRE